MREPDWLLFASDTTIYLLWGAGFVLLALVAMLAEHLRHKRRQIDKVGCIPWTAIFLAAAMCAAGLITMAVQHWAGK